MFMKTKRSLYVLILLGFCALPVLAQRERPIPREDSLTFEEYDPKSTLVTKEHLVPRAKFPLIDIHSHQTDISPQKVDQLIKEMDSINLQVMVNLSGGTGERLKQVIAAMKGRYPKRFVVFANL